MAEKKDIKPAKVPDILEDVKTDICEVSGILEDVNTDICDNFCKYSAEAEDITDSEIFDEICKKRCPLNRL